QALGLRGVLPRLDLSNPATPRRVLALQIDPDRFEKRSQHDIFRGERASNEELKAAAKDLLRRDLRFTGVSIVVEPQERPRPPQVLLNLSASLDPVWVYELDFNYRMIDPELRGPIDSALKQPQPKLDSLIRGKLGSGSPGRVVLQVVWAGALPNGAARYAVRAVISSRPLARLTLIVSSSGRLEVSERGR
ncbi:MAG: hypothetical protein KGK30_09590, partial [Elusimicrobia bacterium]|nr:hypothetical protein [Elusimicrobiota bacterium]